VILRRHWPAKLALLGCAGATIVAPAAVRAACREDLPSQTRTADRAIVADDLVRLRDIGPSTMVMFLFGSPFGVSPDGTRIAFQVRQADPVANHFCLAMVVLDLRDPRRRKIVDRGGGMIRWKAPLGALADYPSGEAKLITPIWSPDGKRIAFLKQTGRHAQIWIAGEQGRSRAVTHAENDVDAFTWSRDGQSIVFRSRPGLAAARDAIEREGKDGYLYDDRWGPRASNRPWPSEPISYEIQSVSLGGTVRRPTPAEEALLGPPRDDATADGASWASRTKGALAWIAPADRVKTFSEGQLKARLADGPVLTCEAAACRGNFQGVWLSPDGHTIWFLHREGRAESETALYNWKPGAEAPTRIFATQDRLGGCAPVGDALICALEQSRRPRRVVKIHPPSGKITEVFDPNPEFAQLRLGQVERLEWRNDQGIDIFGDLVLPRGRKPGEKLPLVIVQYDTRGFLRGGTGDEFPIFAFAERGYAVLSLQRPGYVSDIGKPKDEEERIKRNYEGWADRRSVMSAYARGIALLDRLGLIDPDRVGITGLSDGSASAQFALVNSKLFAAASLSACCEDPKTLFPLLGNNGTRYMRKYRYPAYTDSSGAFWAAYSIASNASTFQTPLLLQASDDEYMLALETYASLRDFDAPVEMVVFPGEHHTKWQPAHRQALYRRNLAWFDFWLKGETVLARPDEISRWSAMRQARHGLRASP